jgi:hypothetical protein
MNRFEFLSTVTPYLCQQENVLKTIFRTNIWGMSGFHYIDEIPDDVYYVESVFIHFMSKPRPLSTNHIILICEEPVYMSLDRLYKIVDVAECKSVCSSFRNPYEAKEWLWDGNPIFDVLEKCEYWNLSECVLPDHIMNYFFEWQSRSKIKKCKVMIYENYLDYIDSKIEIKIQTKRRIK